MNEQFKFWLYFSVSEVKDKLVRSQLNPFCDEVFFPREWRITDCIASTGNRLRGDGYNDTETLLIKEESNTGQTQRRKVTSLCGRIIILMMT